MCMVGCPFGAVRYDSTRKKVFKCELCEGDPQCVKFCPTGSLQFVPRDAPGGQKADAAACRVMRLQRVLADGSQG
jgi:Fe-S-cluster-containing hydrogenase component 2